MPPPRSGSPEVEYKQRHDDDDEVLGDGRSGYDLSDKHEEDGGDAAHCFVRKEEEGRNTQNLVRSHERQELS